MAHCSRVVTAALSLFTILAADARGQRLLEVDGIELHGAAQLVMPGGGTCNVLESDTSYEARKGNHGASMDIWRLDFSVLNGSGRWLDHLIARYRIESKWPECTNWDGPEAGVFSQNIEWADSAGHIQESGHNVVAPGRTLNATHLLIVLRGDPQPQFANWSMDFDFAAAPPSTGFGAAAAAQQMAPVPTPEQENIFWQSIVDSTDPADFKSYLQQFPNGVFRALAQNRLRALEKTTRADPVGTAPAGAPPRALEPPPPPVPAPLCDFEHENDPAKFFNCWYKLTSPPDCYAWVGNNSWPGADPEWTGQCIDGVASGSGTLIGNGWNDRKCQSKGSFRAGKKHGRWLDLRVDGLREEGPYVEGQRQGRWLSYGFDESNSRPRLIELYSDGERIDYWDP